MKAGNKDDKVKKAEEGELARTREDFRNVFMRNSTGKRVLNDILGMCHIFQTTFTGNSQGMFMEGKRAIGLAIMQALQVDSFDAVLEMEKNEEWELTSFQFNEDEES